MNHDVPRFQGGRRLLAGSLGLALLGALGLLLGAFVAPARLAFSYLTALASAATLAIGALIFLMIVHAMRAGWPVAVRRVVETIVSALPILALLFVPLLFVLDRLYPWLRPELVHEEHARHLLEHKRPYLNGPAFLVRAAVYFGIWIAVGALLRRWSLRRDADPARDVSTRFVNLSSLGLPLVGLALVFAAVDWMMSLDPLWVSTMYPINVFAGGFVAALALITALTFAMQRAGLLPGINESHYYALGRLLLAFTIFWAYTAFFQFMIIWIANNPHEVTFYLRRWRGPWAGITVILVFVRFVVPFFLLLSYRLKRQPARLAALSVWILAAHWIDVHWLIVPEHATAHGFPYHWLDLAALLAVGGISTAFAVYRLRGERTMPVGDPNLPRAIHYESV